MIESPYLVRPGKRVRLDSVPADDKGSFKDKPEGEAAAAPHFARLGELQEVLFAESRRSVLIVLQGMDTSGKDGAIRTVFSAVDPQGCSVVSFKSPSAEELAHDYLWRVHAHTPAKGMIAIFNRSHYESLLIERVRGIAPKEVWARRFEHVNAFERMLVDEGTTVLKFFLHISKDEQRKRLQSRLENPEKNWKFDPSDLAERKLWDRYAEAYEDVLNQCSTEHAPWYVVPADRKWYRNWVLSDVIVRAMEGMKLKYPRPVEGVEKIVVE